MNLLLITLTTSTCLLLVIPPRFRLTLPLWLLILSTWFRLTLSLWLQLTFSTRWRWRRWLWRRSPFHPKLRNAG